MKHIAIVEDDYLIREFIAEAPRDLGAEVHRASDGDAGRTLLSSRAFDLALIDVRLPGVSGFALAEVAANANTPPLLMSGGLDASDTRGVYPSEASARDAFHAPIGGLAAYGGLDPIGAK